MIPNGGSFPAIQYGDIMNINKKYYGCFDPLPKRPYKPTAIVIHHTCTKSPERTQKALKEKNYSTHFEVDMDGTIYQYADVNLTASHCCGVNSHVIGIDLTHLKDKPFPQVQVDAAKELVSYLCQAASTPVIHGTAVQHMPMVHHTEISYPTDAPSP